MRSHIVRLGAYAALADYGVKTAKGFLDEFLTETRQQAVGDPALTWKQLRKGTLFNKKDGLLYHGIPRTPGHIAATLAWPVLGSILLAKHNPDVGAGALTGDLIGRTAGAVVGTPLGGMTGQLLGSSLLGPVGQTIGSVFDSNRPKREPVAPSE